MILKLKTNIKPESNAVNIKEDKSIIINKISPIS